MFLRLFLSFVLASLMLPSLGWSYSSSKELRSEPVVEKSLGQRLGSRYRKCFNEQVANGHSRPSAGAFCSDQIRKVMDFTDKKLMVMDMGTCIQMMTANSGAKAKDVEGLCAYLLRTADSRPLVDEDQNDEAAEVSL